VRAWESREVEARSGHDKGTYSFKSITADETEFLFLMLCPCLDGLVDSAVYALNIARKQVSPLPEPVKDPMPACLLAYGRLLTWYSNSMTPNMTRKQIMECKVDSLEKNASQNTRRPSAQPVNFCLEYLFIIKLLETQMKSKRILL